MATKDVSKGDRKRQARANLEALLRDAGGDEHGLKVLSRGRSLPDGRFSFWVSYDRDDPPEDWVTMPAGALSSVKKGPPQIEVVEQAPVGWDAAVTELREHFALDDLDDMDAWSRGDETKMKRGKDVFLVFCRQVGPGGTSVTFYPSKDGLVGVWENEETGKGDDYESHVSWDDLRAALAHAPSKPSGAPPQPRHNPQSKKRHR